jgi:predicted dinucleotide-binding enzyme
MRIGIIGAGNIGGTLARRLTELGHDVSIANSRGPETLAALAKETGARPVTVEQAARAGDVVIVTIPEKAVRDLPKGLFDGVSDKVVVVDTGNYYPRHRDGLIQEVESGKTESRWVSDWLGRPVVKAFNNIRSASLGAGGRPKGAPGRIALPVAGDDPPAKSVVMHLVEELGFDSIDAGGLDESWRQQPGTPVYTADFDADRVRRALAEASPERQEAFRAGAAGPAVAKGR